MRCRIVLPRMVSGWLEDPVAGLNAHIASYDPLPGDARPARVAAVLNPTADNAAVTGKLASGKPTVFVTVPSRWRMQGSVLEGRRRTMTVPLVVVFETGANGADARQYVQAESTMDCVMSVLDAWLARQPRDRKAHGVTILNCTSADFDFRKTERGLQASVTLSLTVQDERPA